MKKLRTPRLMFALSMCTFGTLGLFVRNISATSAQLALYRALLAVFLIGAYLAFTHRKIEFCKIKKEFLLLLLGGGLILGFTVWNEISPCKKKKEKPIKNNDLVK